MYPCFDICGPLLDVPKEIWVQFAGIPAAFILKPVDSDKQVLAAELTVGSVSADLFP